MLSERHALTHPANLKRKRRYSNNNSGPVKKFIPLEIRIAIKQGNKDGQSHAMMSRTYGYSRSTIARVINGHYDDDYRDY